MITIQSDRLTARMLEPGTGLAAGTRFDHTGFIWNVVLDGTHTMTFAPDDLYPAVPFAPKGKGAGLCSEINCMETYEAAAVGERFQKFGVGLLMKPEEERYFFDNVYDCVPYETSFEAKEDEVTFRTFPAPCGGFALEEEKTVRVREASLSVTYRFRNEGEKKMTLTEYCHNFLTLDGLIPREGTRLELPTVSDLSALKCRPRPDGSCGHMVGAPHGVTFTEPTGADSNIRVDGTYIDSSRPFGWRIVSDESPLSICGEVSFIPSYLVLFSRGASICPEVQHKFVLLPGEEITYTRRVTFEG